jgi:mono/diheme cytochrome c family protein
VFALSAASRAVTVTSLLALGLALVAVSPAPVPGAEVPNLERGRALYENHCQVCHTQKVHTRPNRMILTAAEMREVVDRWQREENLRWSAQDIDDVVHFLGVTLYKFQ